MKKREKREKGEKKRRKRKKWRIGTRRKVKLSLTKGKKNQDVEFEGDDDIELTTEEQTDNDSAVSALTVFAQSNFESLRNTPSDTTVLLSFQDLMLELLEDNQTFKNQEFTVSVQLLLTFVT